MQGVFVGVIEVLQSQVVVGYVDQVQFYYQYVCDGVVVECYVYGCGQFVVGCFGGVYVGLY